MVNRENGPTLMLNESESLQKGVITEELMRKMNDNFVAGIFDPHDAITVFKNIFIIARYSESEYIMMCLLPRLSEEEFKSRKLVFTTCDPARPPLRIDFGVGTPPHWQQYCSPSGCLVALLLASSITSIGEYALIHYLTKLLFACIMTWQYFVQTN